MSAQAPTAAIDPAEQVKTLEQANAELKKRVDELAKQLDEHSPESVYAVSFDKNGNPMFTVRARPGEPLARYVFRVKESYKQMVEAGIIKPIAALPLPTPSETTQLPPPPTDQGGNSGTARAVLMKVGTSYAGNKPQLQFECEGLERTLNYTKSVAEMIKLLAPVGNFTAAQLQNGKKYTVNYLIDWELGEPNGEGKRYRNILAVRPSK